MICVNARPPGPTIEGLPASLSRRGFNHRLKRKGSIDKMSEVVVIGAGLGGTLLAFELTDQVRSEDRVTLIGQSETYQFVPSNPWVAIGWREREDIEVDLAGVMQRKNIRLLTTGARRVHPAEATATQ